MSRFWNDPMQVFKRKPRPQPLDEILREAGELLAEARKARECYHEWEELKAELTQTRKQLAEALVLAQQMRGFVKSCGLSDIGADSEWDRWKQCSVAIDAATTRGAKAKP